MVLGALWVVLTVLAVFDIGLAAWGGVSISDASRQDPILRFGVALLFIVALALWLAHSQPDSTF
jgi:hypothetical protein